MTAAIAFVAKVRIGTGSCIVGTPACVEATTDGSTCFSSRVSRFCCAGACDISRGSSTGIVEPQQLEVDELGGVGEQNVSSLAGPDSAGLVISNDSEMSVRREGGEELLDELPVHLEFGVPVREDVKCCLDKMLP